jgi:hypothetical protein
MQVYQSPQVSQEDWDSLVGSSDDVWLWHSWNWIEKTALVYSLKNHYFIAKQNGQIVGGLPLQLMRVSRYGRPINRAYSLLMGSTGPFLIRGLPSKARKRVLLELTKAAIDWAGEMSVQVLSCQLPPLALNNLNNVHGVNPLVAVGWRDVSGHTRIADLSASESDLWSGLTHDARRSVRLARSAGYTIERASWLEMLDECYRVYSETVRRAGGAPNPKVYMQEIASMEKRGNVVLWVGRDPGGRAVAYHGDARFRDGSSYNVGCCERDHLRSGVNYLLLWHALIEAKQDGLAWYEIGEAYPDVKAGKLRGLHLFKEKFGGELYRYYRGEIRFFDWPPRSLRFVAGILPGSVRRFLARRLIRLPPVTFKSR